MSGGFIESKDAFPAQSPSRGSFLKGKKTRVSCDALGPMSRMGQTLPMDSAPVPPDVRCCSKGDHSRRECEMTRRARNGRRLQRKICL